MAGEAQAAQEGAKVAWSIYQGIASRAIARAQNQVSAAEATAANLVRGAKNEAVAAQTGLAYFMQTENNKRRLAAAAKTLEAGVTNMQRMQESFTTGSIENQLAAAEAGGAYAAHAAMSGTGGNAVDVIDMTMQLKNARSRQAREKAQGQATYDTMAQLTGIIPQSIAGLDMSYMSSGIDYSTNVPKENLIFGNVFTDIISSGNAGTVANAFGGQTGSGDNPTGGLKSSGGTGVSMTATGEGLKGNQSSFFTPSSSSYAIR